MEAALSQLACTPVTVTGSARTDAGVHALGAACHVDLLRASHDVVNASLPVLPAEALRRGVNHHLARAALPVHVTGCQLVDPRVHARFSALHRVYHYRLHVSLESPHPLERLRCWHVRGSAPLDVAAMRAAASALVGLHDFSAFRGSGCQSATPVRTLSQLEVQAAPVWAPFPAPPPWVLPAAAELPTAWAYTITAVAPSFLYRQVRCLVAALVAVGLGRLPAGAMGELLAGRDAGCCPAAAPAHGLYLADVVYGPEALLEPGALT